jgi:hypothetical protein
LSLIVNCQAQNQDELLLVCDGYKYGFIDKNGKVVIDLKYDDGIEFTEGLAAVKYNNKYAFIDEEGKIVLDFKYNLAKGFFSGLAAVALSSDNSRMNGYINKKGEIVIKSDLDLFESFNEGYALVGKIVDHKLPVIGGNSIWGYINTKGDYLIKPKFIEAYDFSEGLALVFEEQDTKTNYGYIDYTGKYIIKEIVENMDELFYSFHNGLVPIRKNNEIVYINKKGEIVIRPEKKLESADPFYDDLASVIIDGLYGFMDKEGKIVIEPKYYSCGAFSEGLAPVTLDKSKWGYINKQGQIVIDLQFDSAESFKNGVAKVREYSFGNSGDKLSFGYIDKTGKYIWKPKTNKIIETTSGAKAISLNASSFIVDQKMYTPYRAFDGDPKTAWLEAANGSGIEESITLSLNKEITVDEIRFLPGYFNSGRWQANNRIKKLIAVASEQTFTINFIDKMEEQSQKLPAPLKFSKVKFSIKDVYRSPGSDNTALSEITFYYQEKKVEIDMSGVK